MSGSLTDELGGVSTACGNEIGQFLFKLEILDKIKIEM